jgi:type I restriction enzyme S subunit
MVAFSTGVSYPAINPSTLGNIDIPFPDLEPQKRIADFLDRETARIDQLIEKKQRLVELLGEKRSAIITAAVTGRTGQVRSSTPGEKQGRTREGLEKERLSRAPHHWTVFRLNYLASLRGGGTPLKDREDYWCNGKIPWVSPKDMKRRLIVETEDYITAEAVDGSATAYVDPGSVLIVVRSGILRHSLPVALAGVRLTLNQDLKAFSLCSRLLPWFFLYWIEGQSTDLLLEWRQFGATVESIDVPRMMNGRIAVPDLPTQGRIVDFLDFETARIDAVCDKTNQSIEKLREFRSALITAAVTGQIDVETWGRRGDTDRRLDAIEEEMGA